MKNITINSSITIEQAMEKLNKIQTGCLIVINKQNKLLGTLTDGDLRRGMLNGANLTDSILNLYSKNPITLPYDNFTKKEAKKMLKEKKIDLIPIIDEHKNLVDYINWKSFGKTSPSKKNLEDVAVIIMAGGKGKRLEPFTKILPKPLIPINNKPIIEHIINRFEMYGSQNFFVSVNYKSSFIKAYFDELNKEYSINYIKENKPLGTIGSIYLLKNKIKNPFFITNCDIIVNTDYNKIYEYHRKNSHDLTLVACMKNYEIPYGTIELNHKNELSVIKEKPKFDFLVNTGLYVMNPKLIEIIPNNIYYDITNLIKDAKQKKYKIGVFPINDNTWIDIGEWDEFKKAEQNWR